MSESRAFLAGQLWSRAEGGFKPYQLLALVAGSTGVPSSSDRCPGYNQGASKTNRRVAGRATAHPRENREGKGRYSVVETSIPARTRWQFQTAMILAMSADALQLFVMPLFAEGALSPADDVLDVAMAAILVRLLGWHWEFLPAFAVELIPGVDLVPSWTFAVLNVYRKWKAAFNPKSDKVHPVLP